MNRRVIVESLRTSPCVGYGTGQLGDKKLLFWAPRVVLRLLGYAVRPHGRSPCPQGVGHLALFVCSARFARLGETIMITDHEYYLAGARREVSLKRS